MIEQIDREIFSRARITKDRNYDGRFFFAVKTTGIFCRPSCPSPVAKEENVEYFGSIFEALELGYRPCARCRPDISLEYNNSYIAGVEKIQQALRLIYDGFLSYYSIEELADRLNISQRQLRKLFIDSIGLPPVKIGRYHKSIFARKLLSSSDQSITDIAFASGFRSTRQFNAAFKDIYGESPSASRKRTGRGRSGQTGLLLKYNNPFNFLQVLAFMEPRLIKGIEAIKNGQYLRTFRTKNARGWLAVCDKPEESALELKIVCDDVRCYMEIYLRVRRMFDLDTDFSLINKQLEGDQLLSRGMPGGRVPRLPVAFDPFEFLIRAILGQQITIKAATTLAGRIAEKTGNKTGPDFPEDLDYFFPNPEELAGAPIGNIGITGIRQQTIRTVTDAVLSGSLSLSGNRGFEEFRKSFSALKGIGSWTVNYVAMRGLGMKDAFPATDLGIIKAFAIHEIKTTEKEIIKSAEKWRPYRSYAALCIWNIPTEKD
ncbi:MAG: DNA-3-methyladenine glycosylase 2 family protein [Spirochaetales bacterium]|nr:DNA-3-methyladenine glycosylase 2 family protein [Spirochaetales bacterium]